MVSERLFVMVLEGRHSLEEYLKLVIPARTVMRAVFSSRLYQFFVNAAPGLKELMLLGKIYYEAERKLGGRDHWDLIVVDGPASGQALSLLKMPTAARQTFGDSVVGREAGNIIRALRDDGETAVVLVTTPEPLPISETLETAGTLREIGIAPAAIVFNRSRSPNFSNPRCRQTEGTSHRDGRNGGCRISRQNRQGGNRSRESGRQGARATSRRDLRSHDRAASDTWYLGRRLVRALAHELTAHDAESLPQRAART